MRSGKEDGMIKMFKAALAQGQNGIMITSNAATRARLIWTYKLPKDRVKLMPKPDKIYCEGEPV